MTPQERLLAGVRAIVRAELGYLGVYGYIVQRAGEGTVDVAPASSLRLPPLERVPVVSSLIGQVVTATPGTPARIRFVNGDPRRPVCTGLGGAPARCTIDALGTLRVGPSAPRVALAGGSASLGREGDSVTFFLPSDAAISGTVSLAGGGTAPLTGTFAALNGMSGLISAGSRAVRAG